MITLVVGGSGSGKSAYAESLLEHFSGDKYYLATMEIMDEESRKKAEKHVKNRAGKRFLTLEKSRNLRELYGKLQSGRPQAVLLECVSNLVANEMFEGEYQYPADQVADKVVRDVLAITELMDESVIVSNNVFEDGIVYEEATQRYLAALASVNCRLAGEADQVVEVVAGIPVVWRQ